MRFTPTFAAAVTAGILAASPVLAASNGYMDGSGGTSGAGAAQAGGARMSVGAIADQFTQKGYTVRAIEADGNRYEVEAINPDGMRVEAYVDPMTGQILREKRDD